MDEKVHSWNTVCCLRDDALLIDYFRESTCWFAYGVLRLFSLACLLTLTIDIQGVFILWILLDFK